jgi:hypothetical protein
LSSLKAGQRLGPYEILAPIGKGGMGEVYKAEMITFEIEGDVDTADVVECRCVFDEERCCEEE